jgi:hypothetical protein
VTSPPGCLLPKWTLATSPIQVSWHGPTPPAEEAQIRQKHPEDAGKRFLAPASTALGAAGRLEEGGAGGSTRGL